MEKVERVTVNKEHTQQRSNFIEGTTYDLVVGVGTLIALYILEVLGLNSG